ncbi:hypothetical protein GCU60_10105 [Blastococcus saxobsidens]|uniref:Uncharacterized protein n=1 Tax=Blastococcus saxobsidens TaxID=138336 RepID=A0A6L9W292_9ACTN|nr:hypothetical protein [Blastococcus saxobsidens]NEK86108.1 hypothetical protein [Blastococcus saxobsidens]
MARDRNGYLVMITTTQNPAEPAIDVVVHRFVSEEQEPRPRRRRIAALALAAGGATLVSAGAFSSWDATANVTSGTLSAGTGSAQLLDANGGIFTTGVSNLLPADWFYRYVDVQNDGSQASNFTGTVTVTGDLAGQLAVEATSCSVAWTTVAGVSTCTGTTKPLAGPATPAAGVPVAVNHGSIGSGAANAQHVRYMFTFSSGAPATLKGKTGSIAIGVTGTVVGGTDRTAG